MATAATETLYEFRDADCETIGIGTEAEAADLIAAGVIAADTKLVLVGEFGL